MKKLKLKSKILLLVLIMLAFYLKKNDFVKLNISKTSIEDTNNKKETFEEVKNKENLNNSEYTIVLNNLNQEYKNEKIKIPDYNEKDYVEINNNVPFFDDNSENSSENLNESYMPLDDLGRRGSAIANVSLDTMPIEIVNKNWKNYVKNIKRGEIGSVRPSGWKTYKFDNVDGKYLYNRCHLLGYQLTAENANQENLITGTRYFNVQGMLPFENMVADYVKDSIDVQNKTSNHVLYRVTPIFNENDLVAKGVLMEAQSLESDDIKYCVFVYNIQPGIAINYSDGSAKLN